MKNKVCECCFWTICMYCSQNNMLITVISSGSYESDCGVDNCRKLVVVVANAVKLFFHVSCCPRGHRRCAFV